MRTRSVVGLSILSVFGLVALLSLGCGGASGAPRNANYRSVPSGRVATPGVRIDAADRSFSLVAEQTFQPPFQSWTPVDLPNLTTASYTKALEGGAKRVFVTVPSLPQPLHGVLALDPVPNCASGPGTRSYEIQVPQEYVDAAAGGQISMVYESVSCSCCNGGSQYSWVLWLSDQPIP